MSEDGNGLPPGWAWTPLGEVLTGIEAGRSPKAQGRPAGPGEFGVLKVSAVSWGSFKPEENKTLHGSLPPGVPVATKDDLLISRANTVELVGAVVLVEADHPNLMLSDKTLRLRASSEVEKPYLLRALRTTAVRAVFEDQATGTSKSMRNLSQGKIRSAPIALAPRNEQKRIVAKIEALQLRSEAAKEALDAIPPLLEKFRQSVLAAAFRGDLTKAWRAANPDVEPATELLKRIRAERCARWIAAAAAKARDRAKAKAAKAGKPWSDEDDAKVLEKERVKAAKKYKEPEPVDAEGLPELPEGWCWARLEDLTPADAAIVYGIIQPGPQVSDGVIYVRPADIAGPNRLKAALPRTSPEIAAKYERASLRDGDLVFSIVGTIGKWFITPPELVGANITQSAVRIRPTDPLDGEFLVRALQSRPVDAQMSRLMFGNAVQRLNVAHVRGLCIPVPPTGEREEVVRIVREAFDGIGSVGDEVASKARLVASLNQSILAKAFRGELVPQDPNDEPASVLLERIRAEREANGASKPKKKGGRGRRPASAGEAMG